jgi:carbon monoxide dehydrogenase subunit G
MRIENRFSVSLPPEQVYDLLLDLERVAPCLPGAELRERRPDGSYALAIKVRLGPMRISYEGSARIAEQDPEALRAVLVGEARETRGQGSAAATVTMTVERAEASSSVATVADLDLSGRAAQMGHGVVAGVAEQLIADMSRCLEQRFAAETGAAPGPEEPAAKPVGGLRLVLRALAASLRRFFSRARARG